MLTNTTPAVDHATQTARAFAHRAGAAEIQPEHLLAALLEQEGGNVEVLLTQAGMDLSRKGEIFGNAFAQGADTPRSESEEEKEDPRFSSRLEETWLRARELARELAADRTLGTDHLLLALLEKEPNLRSRLENLGMSYVQLTRKLHEKQPLQLDEPLSLAEPAEEIHLARILDASANRAREALRVLEDYCRFVLSDAFLSGELKRMRHALADALAGLPVYHLLEARETERDVGRTLTAPGEESRHGLHAVVTANCKRLQEALRTLEEFAKVPSPLTTGHSPLTNMDIGRALEKLRYQSYTIERALTLGALARQRLADVRLCVLVTESECTGPLESTIKEAAAGGATMIQLREKHLRDRQWLELARAVRRWTSKAHVLFIVNDRPDIARLANADGVHLGQDDMPVMEARQILGPERLIGVSTHNVDQVRQAILDGASYIGVGPTFPSATKEFAQFPGPEFVRQVMHETTLPAFAIGGVTLDNIHQVAAAGATRIAVSQAVCQSPGPRGAVQKLLRALL